MRLTVRYFEDIMDINQIKVLVDQGESKTVEFKTSTAQLINNKQNVSASL
jgi:hypothetical protein